MGQTTSQPEKCVFLHNTQNSAVCLRNFMHTPLKWFGKRVGISLGLGFVWSTKGLWTLQQCDLKHGPVPTQAHALSYFFPKYLSIAHSFIRLLVRSLTHSPNHSHIQFLNHSLTDSPLPNSCKYSLSHHITLTPSFSYLMYSVTLFHSFTRFLIHSLF